MSELYSNTLTIVESDSPFKVIREKPSKLPLFRMIGENMFKSNRKDIYPLLDEMSSFTAAEQWFFQLLRVAMDDNNRCIIRNSSLTKAEKNKKTNAVKLLIKRKLIKQVIREEYMINPRAIIHAKNYESSWEYWEKLP